MKRIVVAGIDTNIGKTLASTIICKALGADYWKPIQCGDSGNTDTLQVKRLLGQHPGRMHPEAYALKHPLSPHAAAEHEGISIELTDIHIPPTENHLVIEGAGGPMVPLNLKQTFLDLLVELDADVILVSKNYLGSINHTLLCLEVLKQRNIRVAGILINGAENPSSEKAIASISGCRILGHIDWTTIINSEFIAEQAEKLSSVLHSLPE